MSRKSRVIAVSWIFFVTVGLDQLTKVFAIQNLKGFSRQTYLGDLFRLEYSQNPGAFLSLGAGMSDDLRFWVFTVAVALFLLGSTFYLVYTPKISRAHLYSFAFIIAGGLSNLLDRMFRAEGKVVDFMNLGVGGLRTGIFNIADIAIMGGLVVILLTLFQKQSD